MGKNQTLKGCILQSQDENTIRNFKTEIPLFRAKNRMSQGEFAMRCGLTVQTICKIEMGYTHFSRTTAYKILEVLKGEEE